MSPLSDAVKNAQAAVVRNLSGPLAPLSTPLAELLGARHFTQTTRLIRFQVAGMGKDLLLAERVRVLDGIGPNVLIPADFSIGTSGEAQTSEAVGFKIELQAVSEDAHLELKQFIGQTALLELLTDQSPQPRVWHGHISAITFMGSDGGLARYAVTVEPWLALLQHRVDSFSFKDRTVPEILTELFTELGPSVATDFRFELQDESLYPRLSLFAQYEESNLACATRLMLHFGLFYWFEHEAQDGGTLGKHTLVIADHPGAFAANPHAVVRYTQSGTVFPEDSLTRVSQRRRLAVSKMHVASRDYRSTQSRPVQTQGSAQHPLANLPGLSHTQDAGPYAYHSQAEGQMLLDRQMQGLEAWSKSDRASGPWRSAAPGTTFTLLDYKRWAKEGEAQPQLIVSTLHTARNNLSADARAGLVGLDAQLDAAEQRRSDEDEPIHHVELLTQSAALPYRAVVLGAGGQPDPRLFPQAKVQGVQTAIVVGDGGPVHTDRDHRIKVQFHWQRGSNSSHRLAHPSGDDNAPGTAAIGTWVRVASSTAGMNWGAVAIPRVGQEVIVGFVDGKVDRGVVIAAVPNSQGQANAQGAMPMRGPAGSTGNAPAWFPGDQAEGDHEGHAHPHVLSGIKTQELAHSLDGLGGYNQLVLDDTPGASRLELATTQSKTRLQLGSLLHQDDNRRLNLRGHGFDLKTDALGAVRAGMGLLISTHGKPSSSDGSGKQMDVRDPLAQLDSAQQLLHTLAASAQAHEAKGTKGVNPEKTLPAALLEADKDGERLPNQEGLRQLSISLSGEQSRNEGASEEFGGGTGRITAWTRPDLVLTSPALLTAFTPAHRIQSAGGNTTLVAGQDLHRIAQGHISSIVQGDVTFFTYGRASNSKKPTQQTGIALHAASGSVHVSALKSTLTAIADKDLSVSSTSATVSVKAPKHILLAAGGSGIRIEAGKISLMSDGKVEFKAGMKKFEGGASASAEVKLLKAGELQPCDTAQSDAAANGAAVL